MANKVKFGLRSVYYAPITATTSSTYTYGTPVAISGAVNLTLSAQGDSTDFYADDVIYYASTANNGYQGDLELALLDEDFKKTILGEVQDSNSALIENADATLTNFALGFEVQGDDKPRRVWLYNCQASRPAQDASTKESGITPKTDVLTIKAMPRLSDHYVKVSMVKSSTNETAFNSFFSAVYEKVASV